MLAHFRNKLFNDEEASRNEVREGEYSKALCMVSVNESVIDVLDDDGWKFLKNNKLNRENSIPSSFDKVIEYLTIECPRIESNNRQKNRWTS